MAFYASIVVIPHVFFLQNEGGETLWDTTKQEKNVNGRNGKKMKRIF